MRAKNGATKKGGEFRSKVIEVTNWLIDEIFRVQRWLLWERRGAWSAGVVAHLFVEALEEISDSDFERLFAECHETAEEVSFTRDRLKDRATSEIVWAAATFSLAGLVIGLFALVT